MASSPCRNNGPTESPLHTIESDNRGSELRTQFVKHSQAFERDISASSPAIRRIIRKPFTAVPRFEANDLTENSAHLNSGRYLTVCDPISSSDDVGERQRGERNVEKEVSMFVSSSSQEKEGFFTGEPFLSRVEKGLNNIDSSPLRMNIPSSPMKLIRENQPAEELQPAIGEKTSELEKNKLMLPKSFDATPSKSLDCFSSSSVISPPSPPRLPDLHQFSKPLPTFKLASKSKSLPDRPTKISGTSGHEDKSEARRKRREEQISAKQLEHQFKQANRSRANRLSSVTEMVLQFSKSAPDSWALKCISVLEGHGVTILTRSEQSEEEFAYIKLFRKHTAKYDSERNAFVPVDEFILEEPSIILFITAARLFSHCQSTETFEQHVSSIRQHFKHENILYLVQGYHDEVKRIGRARDKEMTARARRMLSENNENQTISSSQLQTNGEQQKVSPEDVYKKLTSMSIKHGFKVLHCGSDDEVVDWITNLIIDVSTAPYRQNRQELNIKSGSDVRDTVAKMVSQVTYVTLPIAQGIASVYPNAYGLIKSVRKRGRGAIEGLIDERNGKKIANRAVSGAFSVLFGSRNPDEIVKQ